MGRNHFPNEAPDWAGLPRCEKSGKVMYDSRVQAKKAMKRLRKKTPSAHADAYTCPFCGKWHATSQKQRTMNGSKV